MTSEILMDIRDNIATLTFNRPETRNAINREMVQQLTRHIGRISADPAIRCVAFRGTGEHFSGGGDVKGFQETLALGPQERERLYTERVAASAELFHLIEHLQVPIVAVARGAVAGAGLSFLMGADFALASETTFCVFAHNRIGIALDSGLSYYLPRVVGWRKAKELTLSGARLTAEEALELGIVSRILPDAELDPAADKLTASLAAGATRAMGLSKALLTTAWNNDIRAQIRQEAVAVGKCAAGDDFVEGVSAFLQGRKAKFEGR